jgi:hypothetical protein
MRKRRFDRGRLLLTQAAGRLCVPRLTRQRAREAKAMSSRFAWEPPASVVSFAGLHGGAGTTTLCLLLAEALAAFGRAPVLAVDLAGRSRGGLAVLGGASAQTSAENVCAVAAIHGGRLERPFGVNAAGVRIIGTYPDGVEELERIHETTVARLVEAVDADADDARVAELVRPAVRDGRSRQALRWDGDQAATALSRVLTEAAAHHALVAVDLGMLEAEQLAAVVGARSHLHVWVVPARPASLEIARRRLPLLAFEPAGGEAIAVWDAGVGMPSAKRLSRMGDLRGCPVVRVAHHGDPRDDLATRSHRCVSGVVELCELAR